MPRSQKATLLSPLALGLSIWHAGSGKGWKGLTVSTAGKGDLGSQAYRGYNGAVVAGSRSAAPQSDAAKV